MDLDKKFGAPWHCVAGEGFGFTITYEAQHLCCTSPPADPLDAHALAPLRSPRNSLSAVAVASVHSTTHLCRRKRLGLRRLSGWLVCAYRRVLRGHGAAAGDALLQVMPGVKQERHEVWHWMKCGLLRF